MTLKGKYENTNCWVKCLQWFGCIFILGIPAMGSMVYFPQPLSISSLKWLQLIQTSSLLLLPPLFMAYLWSKEPIRWLWSEQKDELSFNKWIYLLTIGIMIVALPAINMMAYWNQQMDFPSILEPIERWMKTNEERAKILTEQFMTVNTIGGLIVNLLLMAVLPALAEEMTFRGVMMKLLSDKKEKKISHGAIWLTAIVFSAIHMQFYGFFPRMFMGALFGYALVWTGSLWTPILMHFTNNAMAVLLYFFALRADWDMEKVDAIGTNDTLWLGVVSMIVTVVGIYAFRRSTTMSKASSRISSGN